MIADSDEAGGLARGVVGSARTIAFGTSIVAPSASAATVLVLVVAFAGYASPLVVLITFAGSLCCALSIGQFAGRLPSAGWAYTYNSRGLGPAAGFLTGWMMIFAYALFVPAGVGLTSAFGSQLLASPLHVTTAALAITILVKIGPAHYPVAVLSPASSPNQRLTDLTDAMIYGFTAFAGFEAAAALGEEATNARRSVPVSIVGVVVVTGIFYLLVVCAEAFAFGRHGIAGLVGQASPLGYLTSRFWSPTVLGSIDLVLVLAGLSFVVASVNAAIRVMYTMGRERALPGALGRLSHRRSPVAAIGCLTAVTLLIGLPLTYVYGGVPTFGYLAGIGGLPVVLIYFTVNIAVIRAFRTEFRDEFRPVPHLLIPAAASVVFLFPLWGILFPGVYTLANLLPFISVGWLLIGAIAAAILRARRPATFQALGRAVAPNLDRQLEPD